MVLIAYLGLPGKLLPPPTPAVVPHCLVYLLKVGILRPAHLKF